MMGLSSSEPSELLVSVYTHGSSLSLVFTLGFSRCVRRRFMGGGTVVTAGTGPTAGVDVVVEIGGGTGLAGAAVAALDFFSSGDAGRDERGDCAISLLSECSARLDEKRTSSDESGVGSFLLRFPVDVLATAAEEATEPSREVLAICERDSVKSAGDGVETDGRSALVARLLLGDVLLLHMLCAVVYLLV